MLDLRGACEHGLRGAFAFGNSVDHHFHLNVAKSSIVIPYDLKTAFLRYVSEVKTEAEKEYHNQGLKKITKQKGQAGDALFIPKGTWHAVVALEPSISLAVFGLTPPEVVINGGWAELKGLLHRFRLYRWGNCACHKAR